MSSFPSIRRGLLASLSALVLTVSGSALAQSAPEMPRASPEATASQRVGLTDFSLTWASPGVKGRSIYGGLVPYGELWRAGANEATLLTVSSEFKLGDQSVPAGTYAIFTVPGEDEWTVVLNKNTKLWGTTGYQQSEDAARISVKPTALAEPRERLTFIFSNSTENSTDLDLEWASVRVRIPLSVDTQSVGLAAIDAYDAGTWRPYSSAAEWLLNSGDNLDKALDLVNTSLALKATWRNNWVKAQILAKQGKKADARNHAEKAARLGAGDYIYDNFYKVAVEKGAKSWK